MIYLDYAATGPTLRAVLEAMWPFMTEAFGNPSSHHGAGRMAAAGLEAARTDVAAALNAKPGEITFTSGGTEANNLAIKGLSLARPRGRHIVTTAIEHKSVLETCAYLVAHHGFEVATVGVNRFGLVNSDDILAALRPDTTLCSVMYANNDVGTIQPISEIAGACNELGVPFHSDGVQAASLLDLDVQSLGTDALTISGHKFGGPKGSGVLYVRSGLPLTAILDGGGQERGLRSGTHNVPGAVGLAAALSLAVQRRSDEVKRLTSLRDKLVANTLAGAPGALLTGHPTRRLANSASFCFSGVGGDAVLQELELRGICCSSGSACAAGSDEASHVLLAMGIDADLARTAVRFSLGASTTEEDIEEVIRVLPEALAAIRSEAP